jgi:dienelactone hydrolase
MTRTPIAVLLFLTFIAPALAQYDPPPTIKVDPAALQAIEAKAADLRVQIAALRRKGIADAILCDVEIFETAAAKIVKHGEFFNKDSAAKTLAVLAAGEARAKQLAAGKAPWIAAIGRTVVRGYRSRIDGTVQPYAISVPANFDKLSKDGKKWRTDVVLHGRNSTITEVGFLGVNDRGVGERAYIQLDIFGRGNNAYRWAGETDVLEAIGHFFASLQAAGSEKLVDPARVVLRGFSMGGAGSWHLGLHFPDHWCVVGPGAGFSVTHGYIGGLKDPLPAYQEKCLTIYDAVDYAENAFDVPIVAYSGSDDPQKAAADNVEKRVKSLGLPMTHLIAPGLKHQFPAEWQKKADVLWTQFADKGRADYPPEIRFVTYSLKYNHCDWVEIVSLDRHYDKTLVTAKKTPDGFDVATTNVRRLHLTLPPGAAVEQKVAIDGQTLTARPWVDGEGGAHLYLSKAKDGAWRTILPQRLLADLMRRPEKTHGLQGPIDDAFIDGFVCVRGTGKPWHEATGKYAAAELARFEAEWSKYFRGTLPIKDDVDVTNDELIGKNLILFGDPASNSILGHVADALPLRWTQKEIVLAGKTVSADGHVPVMIYPNPLSPNKYVVVNSGHTFREKDLKGTNALLYPRLGDYALMRTADPTEPVIAGLFDEMWNIVE